DIGTGFGHFAIATPDVYKFVEHVRAKGGTVTREPGPVSGGSTVIAFVKDPDGYIFEILERASTPEPLCQVMLRVGDLERSIKFYEKALGLKLVKKVDRPQYKYTLAMLGYAEEHETVVLELTYNYGVTEYTKGNAYAQVAIGTDDVYKSAEVVNIVTQELGGKITRQPGPIPGLNTKITSFLDPDGWKTVGLWLREVEEGKELEPRMVTEMKPNGVVLAGWSCNPSLHMSWKTRAAHMRGTGQIMCHLLCDWRGHKEPRKRNPSLSG
ncbi:lactoylglutathione lyase-like protein, partial [Trifolium pratense]